MIELTLNNSAPQVASIQTLLSERSVDMSPSMQMIGSYMLLPECTRIKVTETMPMQPNEDDPWMHGATFERIDAISWRQVSCWEGEDFNQLMIDEDALISPDSFLEG